MIKICTCSKGSHGLSLVPSPTSARHFYLGGEDGGDFSTQIKMAGGSGAGNETNGLSLVQIKMTGGSGAGNETNMD